MVQCDEKRQKNVEALAAFRGNKTGDKAWVNCGSFFLKLPAPTAKSLIDKDQRNISEEIDEMRASVKADIAELHKFRPSELDSATVRLALRDSVAEGKQQKKPQQQSLS